MSQKNGLKFADFGDFWQIFIIFAQIYVEYVVGNGLTYATQKVCFLNIKISLSYVCTPWTVESVARLWKRALSTNLKSLTSEATHSATHFSKGLTKLAILPDYKRPGMLCLALPARRKVQKLDFQSEFSMSKIIRILTQFSKFNNFLRVCWFLGKNRSNFVPPFKNSTTRIAILFMNK